MDALDLYGALIVAAVAGSFGIGAMARLVLVGGTHDR